MKSIINLDQLNNILKNNGNVCLYGLGVNLEIFLDYFEYMGYHPFCILVDQYTISPFEYSLNPSKRANLPRSSFSETDMMLDGTYRSIPIFRIDNFINNDQYIIINLNLENEDLLEDICKKIYSPYRLKKEYWDTENKIIDDLQLIKNTIRRSLRSTVYDFHFEFHLAEHCNLNCIGCTHFSPLAEPEFLEVEDFRNDIERLSYLTGGNARFINLLGGEPLLHPEINSFFKIAREYFPEAKISIVTNGILLPQMDNCFWTSCRENKIVIAVTEYSIGFDYLSIRNKIRNENIEFESFSGRQERYEMWSLFLDERGLNRPVDNFMKCQRSNACVFCSHGKLFPCPTMASIRHFNRIFDTKMEISESDYIDIYKVSSIQEILDFLKNPVPFCRFCNVEKRKYGLLWQQSKCEKNEWCPID